jgi:hypothetical protein
VFLASGRDTINVCTCGPGISKFHLLRNLAVGYFIEQVAIAIKKIRLLAYESFDTLVIVHKMHINIGKKSCWCYDKLKTAGMYIFLF